MESMMAWALGLFVQRVWQAQVVGAKLRTDID